MSLTDGVTATDGRADDEPEVPDLLAVDAVIDYKTEDFADAVQRHTDKRGVDVILDHLGGAYLAQNVRSLATGGRLAVIGVMGGRTAELDVGRVLESLRGKELIYRREAAAFAGARSTSTACPPRTAMPSPMRPTRSCLRCSSAPCAMEPTSPSAARWPTAST